MNDFTILEHTADAKIYVVAESKEELFKQALYGMFHLMIPRSVDCERVNERIVCKRLPIKRTITLESSDNNALLVDFLSEALTLSDINNEAYFNIEFLHFSDTTISGILQGCVYEVLEGIEVKAVTYHDLNITKKSDDTWYVTVVFDI